MKKLFNFIFYFSFLFLLSIKPSISEEKIKIGLLLPLSGQNSELGKSVLRSVNLAINKIDDPILEVYPKNNYDSPEKNYLAAKELYDSGVRIFIGPIFEKNIKNLEKIEKLFNNLKAVNLKLWSIEDDKRKCEKDKNFGEKFIKLSRNVHFLNDERAKIKLEINEATGSKIKEIKEYTNY